jgi:hypothetical protein
MRAKLTPLSALLAGLVAALAAGCQTYDFEPVDPLAITQTTKETEVKARRSKPNVMLLVDTSGSMTDPVDPNKKDAQGNSLCLGKDTRNGQVGPCGGQYTPCDTTKCPTRWSELQGAMGPFLSSSGKLVRFGLTTYPVPPPTKEPTASEACAAAVETSVRKDLPDDLADEATLQAHADAINQIIQGIPNFGDGMPAGGTPTGGSINFVSTRPSLSGGSAARDQIVILLTDGLPNCNVNNVYSGEQATECACTVGSQCINPSSPYYRRGCLDKNATVQAIADMKTGKDISTIVIGFGAETAGGDGLNVLNGMAEAGGFPRKCKVDADCGTDACETAVGLCSRRFYQAGNQEELSKALAAISNLVVVQDPCLIGLDPSDAPSDPKLIVVYVDGQRTTEGDDTWKLTDKGVVFQGATCEKLKASRPEAPVKVEVRAIQQH